MKDKHNKYDCLRAECAALARESVQRSLTVARLEAEVMALRERYKPQPISTCPRDGSLFLTWCTCGWWHVTCHEGEGDNFLSQDGYEATHWVPLPKPPVMEGRE